MRVLFTTSASTGHFHPLLPLARVLEEAAHNVGFATGKEVCQLAVERRPLVA
jgi:UDP:flavonoid glycosyltransferase YjiC (YdhE family)